MIAQHSSIWGNVSGSGHRLHNRRRVDHVNVLPQHIYIILMWLDSHLGHLTEVTVVIFLHSKVNLVSFLFYRLLWNEFILYSPHLWTADLCSSPLTAEYLYKLCKSLAVKICPLFSIHLYVQSHLLWQIMCDVHNMLLTVFYLRYILFLLKITFYAFSDL